MPLTDSDPSAERSISAHGLPSMSRIVVSRAELSGAGFLPPQELWSEELDVRPLPVAPVRE